MELLWALEHDRLRRERVFKDRLNPLAVSDAHLLRYYRYPRSEIQWLCEKIGPEISRHTNRSHSIPVATQVLVALRFYASGTFQSVIGDSVGLSQSSVSRIINAVTSAIFNLAQMDIKMPRTRDEIQKTKQDFFAIKGFPNVLGAIDCTHIPIKPPRQEHIYLNRKRVHSLNVQVVSDAHMKILSFSAKFPGSVHDSYIWNDSNLRRHFLEQQFGHSYLLGDSGYPLETCLMTPLAEPTTPAERRYNSSHACTRAVIEKCFGVLKSRFRCLHKSGGALQYTPEKCAKIVASCLFLHNVCVQRRIPFDDLLEVDDSPEEAVMNFMIDRSAQQERMALINGSF
ncbi:putative nuclease HARBI1 [Penaeus japonicus]|uniref:putative nuclease HARBI1 n=1 Tax=Penaeus japonicus TaxID=27405 RepID=UPI001C71179E|nr:putative nuclease HARBI1 [Penaeus japonicus]